MFSSVDKVLVGVDVGETHTCSVLIQGSKIISKAKTPNTSDNISGIAKVINTLFERHQELKENIHSINIGTRHLEYSLIHGQEFNKTLVVRLAAPLTDALPPTVDWDKEEQDKMGRYLDKRIIIKGGYEFKPKNEPGDPKVVSPLDCEEIQKLAKETYDNHTEAVAITGLYSINKQDQEEKAAALFQEINPSLIICLSHQIEGSKGLLQREKSTILNGCMSRFHQRIIEALKKAIQDLKINCENIFLTLADGTKRRIEATLKAPLLTLDSGPANSAHGASLLVKRSDAVTLEVGEASTHIGIVRKGNPLVDSMVFQRGGINLNCSSFRFKRYALGEKTRISISDNGNVTVGPHSIQEPDESYLAHGKTLTVSDIAYLLNRLPLKEHFDRESIKKQIQHDYPFLNVDQLLKKADEAIHEKLVEDIEEFIQDLDSIPPHLVLVGHGCKLFNLQKLRKGLSKLSFEIPEDAEFASAIGAACSNIGSTYTAIYSLAKQTLAEAKQDAYEMAKNKALQEGADEKTIREIAFDQFPLSYLPGKLTQIKVSVVGEAEEKFSQKIKIIPFKPAEEKICEQLVVEQIKAELTLREAMKDCKLLTEEDIEDIAKGSGFLGSGGGGNAEVIRLMTVNALKSGKNINILPLDQLPDEATVVICAGVGSPTILYERLYTSQEGVRALRALEKKIGRNVDALISGECGGGNAFYSLFISSHLNIPVVDGDCSGRCFPEIQMMLPNIYGEIKDVPFTVSNSLEENEGESSNLIELEQQARGLTIQMGGHVSIALMPMKGSDVKKWALPSTISILQKMGGALRKNKKEPFDKKLDALNEVLNLTPYKKAQKIGEGNICAMQEKKGVGFNIGGFLIKDPKKADAVIEIGYKNENLVARLRQENKSSLAVVPHLITLVDPETFNVISCEKLNLGQPVVILSLTAPEQLCREQAMKILGPEAESYHFKELLEFLDTINDPNSLK